MEACLIAPVAEELLMRQFALGGLKVKYGMIPALLISTGFFALLHFNLVQSLSALFCGLLLGLLFLKTRSVLCCIFTHAAYNTISFLALLFLAPA